MNDFQDELLSDQEIQIRKAISCTVNHKSVRKVQNGRTGAALAGAVEALDGICRSSDGSKNTFDVRNTIISSVHHNTKEVMCSCPWNRDIVHSQGYLAAATTFPKKQDEIRFFRGEIKAYFSQTPA